MNTLALLCLGAGLLLVVVLQIILLWRAGGRDDAATQARLAESLAQAQAQLRDELSRLRQELAELSGQQRVELSGNLNQFGQTLGTQVTGLGGLLAQQLKSFGQQLATLTESNTQRLNEMRATLEVKLREMQTDNAAKLDEMRKTVDEKLHATLEQRLGESFKLVSERLELVHKGLGEMQNLATGVGDLKRVLSNVKTRGTWGEVQLGNLLEQLLTPEQYAGNVVTRPNSKDPVEFAIRLPGRGEQGDAKPVWLPIDAKFPREDYERLLEAQERADAPAAKDAINALAARLRLEAKKIHEKYIEPPHTTDFALMFLPTEGLYAEAIRCPGLSDELQRLYRVTLAGPTTLTALLNSLQMGFRTLAIEKRSSEVWQVLSAVKTEFSKFGDVLDKVKKKLDEASHQIDATGVRSRAIQRQLREVEALPAEQAQALLGGAADAVDEEP
ncbi:MAG TPA: DNA recombination protein RmuC [Stenotrophobium sp.]|nr:DNA recombination protein RmuC [Stenotrophobium sp.]